MPTVVTARAGDTLCELAISAGFPNCDRLRTANAGAAFLSRPLQAGDRVTIPDVHANPADAATARRHRFRRRGAGASIRFIHGTPDLPPATDPTLTDLHISNYVTTRTGVPETSQTFPSHTSSAFHAGAHADVDSFKVELFDPRSNAATHDVELVALRPIYARDGSISRHDEFPAADRAARALTVTCRRLASDPHRYRSCYLRLVTFESDKRARPRQTLMVTDTADGNAAAADQLEVLDQRVRVAYPLPSCNAAAPQWRCQALAELPIGSNRLRFRVQVHVQRTAPGGAALVGGITLQEVRRHMAKWVRRTYSQADMGFRYTGVGVNAVDPLRNLISLFNPGRRLARGGRAVSVRVNTTGGATTVTHNTVAGETPLQAATDLATQISALPNFSAQAFQNPRALSNAQSADVLVTRSDGNQVVLDRARSTDSRVRVGIGRVRANVSTTASVNYGMVGARDHRTLIRNHATDPTAVNVFVIRRFRASDGAVGFAYSRDFLQPAPMQAIAPVLGCCFVDQGTLRSNDRQVHTTDHEIGHILCDMIHFSGRRFELMTDAPVDNTSHLWASKRLTDRQLPYRHAVQNASGIGFRNRPAPVNPVQSARTREAGAFLEGWPR